MFCSFGHGACGILAPGQGIKPTPPALDDEALTTGPSGKSQCLSFLCGKVLHTVYLKGMETSVLVHPHYCIIQKIWVPPTGMHLAYHRWVCKGFLCFFLFLILFMLSRFFMLGLFYCLIWDLRPLGLMVVFNEILVLCPYCGSWKVHWPPSHPCCCSVTKSRPTLCDPVHCSQSFLALHCLLEFSQIHVHWVGHAIQTSHPLSPLLLLSSPWRTFKEIIP